MVYKHVCLIVLIAILLSVRMIVGYSGYIAVVAGPWSSDRIWLANAYQIDRPLSQ